MSTAREQIRQDMDKQPEQLQREADDVRVDMEHTVDELANQFSPGELINHAMGFFRGEGDSGFVRNLSTQIQNNPVPAILAGVGLTWLMTASKQPPAQGARTGGNSHAMQSAGDKLSSVADRARSSTQHMTESASDMKQRLSDSSHQMMDSARTGARSVRSRYDNMLQEQPLMLGALAVAAGAALGALMPRTDVEDRTMGKVSDEQKESAKQQAEELQEKAESKVEDKLAEQRSQAGSSEQGTSTSSQSASFGGGGTASSTSTGSSTPFSDEQRRDTSSPRPPTQGDSPASMQSRPSFGAGRPADSEPPAGRAEEGVPPANPSAVPNHPDANPPTLNHREDGQR